MSETISDNETHINAELVVFYSLCVSKQDDPAIAASFEEALKVSRYKTMQIVLWTCDSRAGLCSDKVFKHIAESFVKTKLINAWFKIKIVKALMRIGKWNLVCEILKYKPCSKLRIFIFNEIKKALKYNNINCAKAMPRNGDVANRIRGYLKLSPIEWRKILVPICADQVTVLMSAGKWNQLDYSKIPTHLLVQYYHAFRKHDKERFREYLANTPARSITINRIMRNPPHSQVLSIVDVFKLNYFNDNRHRSR